LSSPKGIPLYCCVDGLKQYDKIGINEYKRGYQPGSNLVKDENGDLLADSHIFNR
jgi:hypothetical protein